MKRRELAALLGAAAIVWPLAARAQRKAMPVIGFLGVGSPSGFAAEVAAFNEGLKQSGRALGDDVAVEYRWADGHFERLPMLAEELIARDVHVIATSGGTLAARAEKNAIATIPIVFETGVDPVETGLVRSFAHPGANLTGTPLRRASSIQSGSTCCPNWCPMRGS